ncbi:MAG: hypothetical protein M1832_001806 [Thelocarpon impressellum]|nr:MAG: hypothetical protein M1832_001806 [Thelocarpon impressellum]
MSDDPSAPSSSSQPRDVGPEAHTDLSSETRDWVLDVERVAWRRIKAHAQRMKRAEFLDNLMRNLDIVLYCEFSVLYYMDCSFIRFLFRSLFQLYYLTPKPPFVPEMTRTPPYIATIFGTNVICFLLHVIYASPSAGEATRGYLHGGMIIDFVGQPGPTSKIHLLLLDAVVLALQLVMLAVMIERQGLKTDPSPSQRDPTTTPNEDITIPNQDHDSEERGILRTDPTSTVDIELQPLPSTRSTPQSPDQPNTDDPERAELLAEPHDIFEVALRDHPLDIFHSGESIAADLHILATIRNQWYAYENRGSEQRPEASSARSSATAAASWASSRLGIRVRVGGRQLG